MTCEAAIHRGAGNDTETVASDYLLLALLRSNSAGSVHSDPSQPLEAPLFGHCHTMPLIIVTIRLPLSDSRLVAAAKVPL